MSLPDNLEAARIDRDQLAAIADGDGELDMDDESGGDDDDDDDGEGEGEDDEEGEEVDDGTGGKKKVKKKMSKKKLKKLEKKKEKARVWQEVKALVDKEAYDEVVCWDQLNHEMARGRVLTGFHSPMIDFKPTFKVSRGEGLTYNPKRTPSYCDRILWRSLPGHTSAMRFMGMENCVKMETSDHKPVRAMFDVTIPRRLHLEPVPTLESPCLFIQQLSLSLTRKELEESLLEEEKMIKERSMTADERSEAALAAAQVK